MLWEEPLSCGLQALGNHISGLERSLHHDTRGGGAPSGWGDIDRLLSQKDELEEKVRKRATRVEEQLGSDRPKPSAEHPDRSRCTGHHPASRAAAGETKSR